MFFLWEYLEQDHFVLVPWSTTLLNTFWSLFAYGLGKWREDDSLLLLNSQLKHKPPRSLFHSGVGFHSSPSPSLYLCANVLFPLTCKLPQNCYLTKIILLFWKSQCFSISLTIIHLPCVISEPALLFTFKFLDFNPSSHFARLFRTFLIKLFFQNFIHLKHVESF